MPSAEPGPGDAVEDETEVVPAFRELTLQPEASVVNR